MVFAFYMLVIKCLVHGNDFYFCKYQEVFLTFNDHVQINDKSTINCFSCRKDIRTGFAKKRGAVLVFLPGLHEIHKMSEMLDIEEIQRRHR